MSGLPRHAPVVVSGSVLSMADCRMCNVCATGLQKLGPWSAQSRAASKASVTFELALGIAAPLS